MMIAARMLAAGMMILVLVATAGAQGLSQAKKVEEVGLSSERLSRIDAVLKADIGKGQIAGAVALVARKGKIAYFKTFGMRNQEKSLPMEKDTIFRIFSMSKPVVAVAAAMLLEEGKLVLADPVSKYIPSFKDIQVGEIKRDETGKEVVTLVKPLNVMTIQDLLRHTSGLSYWFYPPKAISNLYLQAGMKDLSDLTLEEVCNKLAKLPLVVHPGTRYQYGHSSDVMGRIVEIISGMPLDKFFDERIFKPLRMKDTGFLVKGKDVDRLAYLDPKALLYNDPTKPMKYLSAGGGLVSTTMDYARFAQMLLNGGKLEGKRLLGPRTVAFMTSDQLGPMGDRDDGLYVPGRGYGEGFEFYVRVDAGHAYFPGNIGEFYKGGAGGTVFWVDPKEDLVGVFMVSAPEYREHYRFLMKSLIYQAIVD
ncbi:MAG: serine hydrolase domain-containing protein [Planctomycetaceae bacterium]